MSVTPYLTSFTGMPIVVVRPQVRTERRTWRERLLSWPWRPWQRTKVVVAPAPVPTDKCYQIGGTLYCGEQFYAKLREATR